MRLACLYSSLLTPPSSLLFRLLFRDLHDDLVDEAEVLGLLGGEVTVALGLALDALQRLAGVHGEDLVEAVPLLHDLGGLDLDVADLAADLPPGLVDHDLRVRQREALALAAGGQ